MANNEIRIRGNLDSSNRSIEYEEPQSLEDGFDRQTRLRTDVSVIQSQIQEYKSYGTVGGELKDDDWLRRANKAAFLMKAELTFLKRWIRQKLEKAISDRVTTEGPDFIIRDLIERIDSFIEHHPDYDTHWLYKMTFDARKYLETK